MARPKKEGIKFSCLLSTPVYERLHEFAQEHAMTITGITELALKKYMDEITEREENEKKKKR